MTNDARFDFGGTRVLVTGGTSGIGHAIARSFVDAGAHVTVTGTKTAADEYDTDLSGLRYATAQMGDRESIEAVIDGLDTLDVLINNAGATFPGGRDEWDPTVFAEALSINLVGAMHLTVGCHDHLRASTMTGGASVVNLVSMSAFRAVPIVPGYGSAKAGLVELTRNLANQWVHDGIRVNALAPGLIDTPMTAPMQSMPELLDAELRRVPMGRMGLPADVAGAALFLSSSAASYVTGHVLAVDGGFLSA